MKRPNQCILVFMLMLCLLLTGCKAKETDISKTRVEEFLTLYQSLDSNAGSYLADRVENTELKFDGLQALLAKKMNFSIGKVENTSDGCLVRVKIETIDFEKAFESVAENFTEGTSENVIIEELYALIDSGSIAVREFSVDVLVQEIDGDHKIVLTPELSNALFGGYNEYISKLVGGMLDEQENN